MDSIKNRLKDIFKFEGTPDSTLPYYSYHMIHFFFYFSVYVMHNPYFVIMLIFCLMPALDYVLPYDDRNLTKDEYNRLRKDASFKVPLVTAIFLDWVNLLWTINFLLDSEEGLFFKFGVFFMASTIQGISINNSHEINHKLPYWERAIGILNLGKNFYMHFMIEHNYGHHKNVATYDDPATSRLNESIFAFLKRCIISSYFSAWKLEAENIKEWNKPWYTNRMIYFTIALPLFPTAFGCIFGAKAAFLQIAIGLVSILYLEVINYIEHYGLERKKDSQGKYENINITHSWNSPHRISNYLLFKLQRHSDHHENSLKPYQTLSSYEESPTLLHGYAVYVLLSFNTSLFFKITNSLLEIYKSGKKPTQAEIDASNTLIWEYLSKVNYFLALIFVSCYLL